MTSRQVFEFIAEQIREVTNEVDMEVTADSSWADVGLDSVQIVGIAVAVEDSLGIEISEDVLYDNETIGALADYIHSRLNEAADA